MEDVRVEDVLDEPLRIRSNRYVYEKAEVRKEWKEFKRKMWFFFFEIVIVSAF